MFVGPEFADEEHIPLPPQIILFLENIWELAEGDEKIFRDEVHTTFLHELGHYLGLDEDDLTERGLEFFFLGVGGSRLIFLSWTLRSLCRMSRCAIWLPPAFFLNPEAYWAGAN